jgi:hypothetical protein
MHKSRHLQDRNGRFTSMTPKPLRSLLDCEGRGPLMDKIMIELVTATTDDTRGLISGLERTLLVEIPSERVVS